MATYDVTVQRVYETPENGEGARVLVDRIWPRGASREDLADVEWFRDVAPSNELRKWFGHDPERFAEFRRAYRDELGEEPASEELRRLRDLAQEQPLVLLTATKDVEHSHAAVLAEMLRG